MTLGSTLRDVRDDQLRSPTSHQFSGTDVWQLLNMQAIVRAVEPFLVWQPFVGEARRDRGRGRALPPRRASR